MRSGHLERPGAGTWSTVPAEPSLSESPAQAPDLKRRGFQKIPTHPGGLLTRSVAQASPRHDSFSGKAPIVVQSLNCVLLPMAPWAAARQAPLSCTVSLSLLKPMSIESVMPSNHLILCCPLLLPPSIFPSIRVFSNELTLHIRRPKY